jgi:hypothetical protein
MDARAPKRLNVNDLLLPEDAEFLGELATSKGLTRIELLRRIVDAEADRLRHTVRSEPKTSQTTPQVRGEVPNREVRGKAKALEAIFDRLRVTYGRDFDTLLGGVYREFERIVQSGDGDALDDFEKACPWLVNTHLKAP